MAADLIQRTVVTAAVALRPGRRHAILAVWQQWMARIVLMSLTRVGGARIADVPKIPNREGVLVLMNHQSLVDIPLVVRSVRPGYPRIVTRERYASGKPLISHMVRLYQYPTVNPRSTVRGDLEVLGQAVAASPVPVVIFPEGTRSRDGSLRRFKRAGLRAILESRDWEVWIGVADGFWECARLHDFMENVPSLSGAMTVDGPHAWSGPGRSPEDVERFIDSVEARMRELLADLRRKAEA